MHGADQRRAYRRLRFAGILQDLCGLSVWDSLLWADRLDCTAAVELIAATQQASRPERQLAAHAALEELRARWQERPDAA